MTIWSPEIKEVKRLYDSIKGKTMQSVDVCVHEFHFLLFPVFILEVKSRSENPIAGHLNFTSYIKISKNR